LEPNGSAAPRGRRAACASVDALECTARAFRRREASLRRPMRPNSNGPLDATQIAGHHPLILKLFRRPRLPYGIEILGCLTPVRAHSPEGSPGKVRCSRYYVPRACYELFGRQRRETTKSGKSAPYLWVAAKIGPSLVVVPCNGGSHSRRPPRPGWLVWTHFRSQRCSPYSS
jgi:hypothetical protein